MSGQGQGRGRSSGGGRGRGGGRVSEPSSSSRMTALLQLCSEEILGPVSPATVERYRSLMRQVVLITNHYLVRWGTVRVLHWTITITSPTETEPDKRTSRKVFNRCKTVGQWAESLVFDDVRNIYGRPNDLPDVWQAPVEVDGNQYEVKVQKAEHAELHYNPKDSKTPSMEVQQFLDIAIRHSLVSHPDCIMFGQRYFHHELGDEFSLGPGLKGWLGYRQKQQPCGLGLQCVVGIKTEAVMPAKNAAVFLAELLDASSPSEVTQAVWARKLAYLRKNFDGLEVMQRYGGYQRRRRIARQGDAYPSVSELPANQEMVEGTETIAAYFKRMHSLALKYPALPCLRMQASDGRRISIPPELLETSAKNKHRKLLSAKQQEQLRDGSTQKPLDRARYIQQFVESPLLQSGPLKEHYGLTINTKAIKTMGHVLPAPGMLYGSKDGKAFPKDIGQEGQWNLTQGDRLLVGANLTSLSMVCLVRTGPEIRDVLNKFLEVCRDRGMQISEDLGRRVRIVPVHDDWSVERHLREGVDVAEKAFGKKPDLILVALPSKDCDEYAQVKAVTDTRLGIPSQCFDMRSALKMNNAYYQNIALKINQKLPGGVNTALAQAMAQLCANTAGAQKKPFMMVGIDVRHPSKLGAKNGEKSTAAVTGSISANLGRWAHSIRSQEPGKETVTALEDMMKEVLLEFYRANPSRGPVPGLKPEAIFVFRDGVAEGQFEEVLSVEFNAIRRACLAMDPREDYTPRITFLVVQKRHLTRLMPEDRSQADRNGNALPGTVVNTQITRAGPERNFFLNAHASIQGTNRAVHCYVLKDENGFGPTSLELFTYWSCYICARCTRAVSYPAPAYYAHLAASRGHLLRNVNEDVKIHDNLKNKGMFWL